jgi:hypothetical protein
VRGDASEVRRVRGGGGWPGDEWRRWGAALTVGGRRSRRRGQTMVRHLAAPPWGHARHVTATLVLSLTPLSRFLLSQYVSSCQFSLSVSYCVLVGI